VKDPVKPGTLVVVDVEEAADVVVVDVVEGPSVLPQPTP
jgi:hypothetical protein